MSANCPACSSAVDPLRAGHVAIFDDRFFYFCDVACRQRVAPIGATPASRSDETNTALATSVSTGRGSPGRTTGGSAGRTTGGRSISGGFPDMRPQGSAAAPAATSSDNASRLVSADASALGEDTALPMGPTLSRLGWRDPNAIRREIPIGTILLGSGVLLGALAVALMLAGASSSVLILRQCLCFVGLGAITAYVLRTEREPVDVHPLLLLAPGAAALGLAIWTLAVGDPSAEEAATFAGVVLTGIATTVGLVERARRDVTRERLNIAEVLGTAGRRVPVQGEPLTHREPIKPGEEMTVEAGEVLSVDGNVIAGEAMISPWIGASGAQKRREGDAVLAGARVVTGRLRVRATYTGLDRSWARLTVDPRRRADVHARTTALAHLVAGRGGATAMVVAGLATLVNHQPLAQILLAAVGAYASITTATVASMAAVHVARGVLEGLGNGIAYRNAVDWDRAGDVSIAAFCARGTLLLGEPELADLEPVGRLTDDQVLAFAAGAESTSTHPVAMGVQRAAVVRHVQPDAVRSPVGQPGLGVTAVASTGDALTVGSRALMLREKISVAVAEQKIAEIESRGREVLLVALGGRLIGVIGMQDGLRPGGRAAVQHLLDAQVEPVLLSGDSRETCEAIGRALDIEHVRPEILPSDRAVEIERLSHGGTTVAVIGHLRTDEAALSAADVAVAMPSLGGVPGEWSVMLASDDVRHGALAISLARRTKIDARSALVLALAPGVAFALAVAFGFLPAAAGPLAALLGGAASALHARATDLARGASARSAKGASDFGGAEAAAHG